MKKKELIILFCSAFNLAYGFYILEMWISFFNFFAAGISLGILFCMLINKS